MLSMCWCVELILGVLSMSLVCWCAGVLNVSFVCWCVERVLGMLVC